MDAYIPTREEAFELLREYNEDERLIKHALAVEAVMRYFANKFGEDEEKWRIIGLIHDLDYEKFPEEHCKKTEETDERMNMSKLKPCPFCGETEYLQMEETYTTKVCWISCLACDIDGPTARGKSLAELAWNNLLKPTHDLLFVFKK